MSVPPSPEPLTGQLIDGRYRVGPVIGRGAMSEVYQATDERVGRTVAIKVLRADCTDPVRFAEETNLLRDLDHPNLVRLLDTGSHLDAPYLVLNLLHETLAERLRHAPISARDAARIGAEIAAALGYLHANGIVHRDIKPSNILLRADGTACLADLGAALAIDGPRHTATGLTIGTPLYLAPEQATGDAVTGGTDVYSLGLVLLEATTGQVPFEGTQAERLAARLTRSPAISPALPAAFRRLVAPMVAVDPADRPDAAAVTTQLIGLSIDTTLTEAVDLDQPTAALPIAYLPTQQNPVTAITTLDLPGADPRDEHNASRTLWWAAAAVIAAIVLAGVAWPDGRSPTTSGPTTVASIAVSTTITTAPAAVAPTVVSSPVTQPPPDPCGPGCDEGNGKGKGKDNDEDDNKDNDKPEKD